LNNLNRISVSRNVSPEGTPTQSKIEDAYNYSISRLQVIDKGYSELMGAMIKQATDRVDNRPSLNWSSTILRVGVIGLLVFLTQILISLYRYNSKLIVFYNSLRDALLLCGGELEKVQDYTKAFFPPNLDFGQEPRHLLQEFVGFLGRRTSRGKGKTSGSTETT
jgi:hypothetical protein